MNSTNLPSFVTNFASFKKTVNRNVDLEIVNQSFSYTTSSRLI